MRINRMRQAADIVYMLTLATGFLFVLTVVGLIITSI